MSFATDVRAYAERQKLAMQRTVTQTLVELSGNIITRTPVDTGRLKANWISTLGSPAIHSTLATDQDGMQTTMAVIPDAEDAVGKVFFLANNVLYANAIEFLGKSAQETPLGNAAEGMLRVSVREAEDIWQRAAARNRI